MAANASPPMHELEGAAADWAAAMQSQRAGWSHSMVREAVVSHRPDSEDRAALALLAERRIRRSIEAAAGPARSGGR